MIATPEKLQMIILNLVIFASQHISGHDVLFGVCQGCIFLGRSSLKVLSPKMCHVPGDFR